MYRLILITFFFVSTIFASSIDQDREKVSYQVIVYKSGFPSCYGTILKPELILTGSQCVYEKESHELDVEVDILKSLAEEQEGGIRRPEDEFAYFDRFYKVKSIKTHELSGNYQQDFSFLLLQNKINFNKFVGAVKIPQPNSPIPNVAVTYGFTVKDNRLLDRFDFDVVKVQIKTEDNNALILKGKISNDNVQRISPGGPVTTSDGVLVGIVYHLRSASGELEFLNIQKLFSKNKQ